MPDVCSKRVINPRNELLTKIEALSFLHCAKQCYMGVIT